MDEFAFLKQRINKIGSVRDTESIYNQIMNLLGENEMTNWWKDNNESRTDRPDGDISEIIESVRNTENVADTEKILKEIDEIVENLTEEEARQIQDEMKDEGASGWKWW